MGDDIPGDSRRMLAEVYDFSPTRHGENLYIRGLPEGKGNSTSLSILIKALIFYCTLFIIILCLFNFNCLISNTMGFFRTLQQKAHEHKSSTVTAAKEAEENASFTGSYATLLSEYVPSPYPPAIHAECQYANSSRKQKSQQKTLGGGNRVYNYNRKFSVISPPFAFLLVWMLTMA